MSNFIGGGMSAAGEKAIKPIKKKFIRENAGGRV
jgi:hypothetical protein